MTYTVTYADANFNTSTLVPANIALNETGTASGTLSVSGSGLTRTVTIGGITGNGSLGISIARRHGLGPGRQPGPGGRAEHDLHGR